jgi:DNA replication protein DnaC
LAAKRDLDLPRALRQLENFELLILDDIGYVQQEAQEVEVLFTLLAERYERKSVLITSNLVFSEWVPTVSSWICPRRRTRRFIPSPLASSSHVPLHTERHR